MDARVFRNYSLGELQEIVDALLKTEVITESEVIPLHKLRTFQIDFFDINELLRLAFPRLATYSIDSRKGWFDQSETNFFYEWFALQLLRKCPLNQYQPTCQYELIAPSRQERLLLQAGKHCISVEYQHLNHPEFITELVNAVNLLLKQHEFGFIYYQIRGYDEDAIFLLLTPAQYQHLLTNRLVHFARIDYPEIEAWRETLRREDLPF